MTLGGLGARRAQAGGAGPPSLSRPGGPMGGALPSGAGLPGMGSRRMPPGGGMKLSSIGGMGPPGAGAGGRGDAFSNFNRIV